MILVSSGQSLLDICLQELGDVGAAFELADANGVAITDLLTPGQQLRVPASVLGRLEVVAYFASRMQRINTGGPTLDPLPEPVASKYFNPSYFSNTYFA